MRPRIIHAGLSVLAIVPVTGLCQQPFQRSVCDLIAMERTSDVQHNRVAIYLLDASGKLSVGPIDFGTFKYLPKQTDFIFYVPTRYRMLAASKWVAPRNLDVGGTLRLTSTAPVCPGLPTFNVELVSRYIPPENLPWRWDDRISEGNFHDINPRAEFDADIVFRFNGRILGRIEKLPSRYK